MGVEAWGWGLWVERGGGEGEVGALKRVEETNRKTGKENQSLLMNQLMPAVLFNTEWTQFEGCNSAIFVTVSLLRRVQFKKKEFSPPLRNSFTTRLNFRKIFYILGCKQELTKFCFSL